MNDIPPLVEKFDDITERRKDIYCIDIDGTLTEPHEGTPWEAVPRYDRIEYVNKLYDEGATIYLATARGFIRSTAMHGADVTAAQKEADSYCRKRTEAQLTKWGVKYHTLFFGKPRAAIYVDDRGVNDKDFFPS
tara:strand:+ start:239 stop:640 length:402 start_codon:yes stop_codon:yes gene_type:complete